VIAGFLMELVDRDSSDGIVFGHLVGSRLQCSRNPHGCLMRFCASVIHHSITLYNP
jgi:hypothetical protein